MGSNLPPQCLTSPPAVDAQKLDVLFVVDNSDSMADKQAEVARELTDFVSELRSAGGVAQDLRIGLITTTVYLHVEGDPVFYDCETAPQWAQTYYRFCEQSGRLQPVPDALPDGGVALGTGTEYVLNNDDPQIVEKFSRLVRVGVSGSGQETPFEALRLAVTPPLSITPIAMGGNLGFMRDGARLLIVVISDEDDCSENFVRPSKVEIGLQPDIDYCTQQSNFLTPVSDYHDIFASQIKDSTGAIKDIVYTVIAPVSITTKDAMAILTPGINPDGGYQLEKDGGVQDVLRNIDCPNSHGPGIRHRQMADLFDSTLANLDSVCKPDYSQTLLQIADLAGVSQVLELTGGVPDQGLIKVVITRADKTLQTCTVANGGLTIEMPTDTNPKTRVHFGASCLRRRDDTDIQVSLLCAF